MNFGSEAKFLASGRAAQNAVLSTNLTKNGILAKPIEYEGGFGFLNMYSGELFQHIDVDAVEFTFVKAKHYPVCHCLDPIIQSFQEMLRVNNIRKEQVDSVKVFISSYSRNILTYDIPLNIQESKFSVPYGLAMYGFDSNKISNHNDFCDEIPMLKKIKVTEDSVLSKMDYKIHIECVDKLKIENFFSFDRGFER